MYAYALFPLVAAVAARLWRVDWIRDEHFLPRVSVLLPAYNEEAVIEQALRTLMALDYPAGRFEIVVGSDGSSDRTNEIITRFAEEHPNVRAECYPDRRGKMLVVNDLAEASTGEILFFVDADVLVSSNSLRAHVRHFADDSVGAVAGAYSVVANRPNSIFGSERQLADSESKLRENESLIHSTIGMFGGNYSVRKELWVPIPSPFVYDDIFVVLSLITRGSRVIFEPESIAIDEHDRSLATEFRRKSRNASFGFATLRYFPELVGFRMGLQSIFLWSHKILRWLSPWALLTLVILAPIGYCADLGAFWAILTVIDCAAVLAGMIGGLAYWKKMALPGFHKVFWFLSMQAAFMFGALRFLTASEVQAWVQPPRAKR